MLASRPSCMADLNLSKERDYSRWSGIAEHSATLQDNLHPGQFVGRDSLDNCRIAGRSNARFGLRRSKSRRVGQPTGLAWLETRCLRILEHAFFIEGAVAADLCTR